MVVPQLTTDVMLGEARDGVVANERIIDEDEPRPGIGRTPAERVAASAEAYTWGDIGQQSERGPRFDTAMTRAVDILKAWDGKWRSWKGSSSHFEVLAGIGRTRDLQSLEHEGESMVPALKQKRARQGLEVLKKGLPGCQGLPHAVVLVIHPTQHRMEQQGYEIQCQEHGRQVLCAMAVVMLAMIAFGFEGVVVLVLDFPAGSSGVHDGLHMGVLQGVLRRTCMAIQDGAVGFCGDGQFTPMDPQGIFAFAQGDLVGIPIGVHGAKPPIPAAAGELLKRSGHFSLSQPLVQRWVRLRFADPDEVEAVMEHKVTEGLCTVEIVP